MVSQCRICLEYNSTKGNIFECDLSEKVSLISFIEFICSVKVVNANTLPSDLCEKCYEIIKKIHEFSLKVKHNEIKLKRELNVNRRKKRAGLRDVIQNKFYFSRTCDDEPANDVARVNRKMRLSACTVCKKSFRNIALKRKHEKEHGPSYKCTICEKFFKCRQSLRVHMLCHFRGDPVSCDVCYRFYRDKLLLSKHIRTAHSGESHKCETCGVIFAHASRLKTHARFAHPEALAGVNSRHIYACSVCSATFKRPHHLKRHEILHNRPKPYLCSSCGKGFSQSHYLKIHLLKHGDGSQFSCKIPDCNKEFSQPSSLSRHMLSHEHSRDWLCSSCGARFLTAASLRRHQTNPNSCAPDLPPPKARTVLPNHTESLDTGKDSKSINKLKQRTIKSRKPNINVTGAGMVPKALRTNKPLLDRAKQNFTAMKTHNLKMCTNCNNTLLPNVRELGAENKSTLCCACNKLTEEPIRSNTKVSMVENKRSANPRSLLLPLMSITEMPKSDVASNLDCKTMQQNTDLTSDVNVSSVWLNTFMPVTDPPAATIFYVTKDDHVNTNNLVVSDQVNDVLNSHINAGASSSVESSDGTNGQNTVSLLLSNVGNDRAFFVK